ncbi:MAG: PaaI family thioesterase [Deltaproteobacteria bacterium]|nr:PaaI family thioesterase [Deltaproteobacteria bacterium]
MEESARKRLGEMFGKAGFERAFPGLELVDAAAGAASIRLRVTTPVQNINGALHGGAVAFLVDHAGTLAIITADRDGRAGVTTDLNLTYLAPGRADENVLARARVLKVGRTLAFVSVDVVRESDGTLLAQGRMTKFMGG